MSDSILNDILFDKESNYLGTSINLKQSSNNTKKIQDILLDNTEKNYNTLDKSNIVEGIDKPNIGDDIVKILESHYNNSFNDELKVPILEQDFSIDNKFQNKIDKIDYLSEKLAKAIEKLEIHMRAQNTYIKYAMKPTPDNISDNLRKKVDNFMGLVPKKYIDKKGNENSEGLYWEKTDKKIIVDSLKSFALMHRHSDHTKYSEKTNNDLGEIIDLLDNL